MQKRGLATAFLTLLILVAVVSAKPVDNTLPPLLNPRIDLGPAKNITPDMDIRVPFNPDYRPYRAPQRDESIGEETIVGWTYYDYQHNGSIGKMIVVDDMGGVHITWMQGFDAQQSRRHMMYNMVDENGQLVFAPDNAATVDQGTKSGYGVIDVLPFDGRAVGIYHVLGHDQRNPEYTATAMSVDFLRGIGAMNPFYPPAWPNATLIWPKGSLDRSNVAHVFATENPGEGVVMHRLAYWRGVPNRDYDQWNWTDPPINVDTSAVISGMVTASPQSDKVALAWHHARTLRNRALYDGYGGLEQRNGDLVYLISDDGENWDWRNYQSMTKIIPPNRDLVEVDPEAAWGDTFRPYCDVDIAFDPWENSDQLYAAFATCIYWEEPIPVQGESPGAATGAHNMLFFWNAEQDTITTIFNAFYFNRTDNGGLKERTGAWRMNADRPSIAFDENEPGKIYVAWVNFPKMMEVIDGEFVYLDNEHVRDTSRAGYKGAEVMVSISTNYGITWREPINVTDTRWEGEEAPAPGEMMSEAWMSAAKVADEHLHLMYVRDGDAGGIAQEEGVATNSPVIYQKIPVADLELRPPYEDVVPFHNYPSTRPRIDPNLVRRDAAVPAPNQIVNVYANVVAARGHQLDRVLVEYGVDGENLATVQMSAGEGEDEWVGQIPGMNNGDFVWYRIKAYDETDQESIQPMGFWWGYTVRGDGELRIRDIQYRPEAWAAATDNSPLKGYEITVTGTVTTPASFNSVYGAYAIQDAEEQWSGVFVRGIQEELNVGDRITVTGTVMERDPREASKWAYCTYISVTAHEVIGQGEMRPVVLGVDDVKNSVTSEPWECVLVSVNDLEVDSLTNVFPNFMALINPQVPDIYAVLNTRGLTDEFKEMVGISGFRRYTTIGTLTGVFAENYGYYAITPRMPEDFAQVSAEDGNAPTPYKFVLNEPYPNPFNATSIVTFELPRNGFAKLAVYDISGRLVNSLVEGEMRAGRHAYTIDAAQMPSGVYMLKLESTGTVATRKMVLVK